MSGEKVFVALDRINRPGSDDLVFFYPKEFYVLDNFSSFQVEWEGRLFQTAEHAFQAAKFMGEAQELVELVISARSAHDAQKIARDNEMHKRLDWDDIKTEIMKSILRCKIDQHPYVLKKLLETGDRVIIEDSWRDNEWGWGENKDGKNLLGQIWMVLREEYRAKLELAN